MSSFVINYGAYQGIQSFSAAILFAVLYLLLFPFFFFRAWTRATMVYIFAALFCAIRTTSFAVRATIAKSTSAADDAGINISYGVLFGIGFFGVLYSAYTLVLDRELLLGPDVHRGWLTRALQSRRAVRLLLAVAVALGIAGSDMSFYPSTAATGRALREAGLYVFLAVMVALVIQTLMLAVAHVSARPSTSAAATNSIGDRHGIFILLLLVLLLLVREVFSTVTQYHADAGRVERLWYPLVALPELLAVCLFAVPGLVPSRRRLRDAEDQQATKTQT